MNDKQHNEDESGPGSQSVTSRRGFLAILTGAFVYEVAQAGQRRVDALAGRRIESALDRSAPNPSSVDPKQPLESFGGTRTSYTYDCSGVTTTYAYDSSGPRTSFTYDCLGQVQTYSYDASCRRVSARPNRFLRKI